MSQGNEFGCFRIADLENLGDAPSQKRLVSKIERNESCILKNLHQEADAVVVRLKDCFTIAAAAGATSVFIGPMGYL